MDRTKKGLNDGDLLVKYCFGLFYIFRRLFTGIHQDSPKFIEIYSNRHLTGQPRQVKRDSDQQEKEGEGRTTAKRKREPEEANENQEMLIIHLIRLN